MMRALFIALLLGTAGFGEVVPLSRTEQIPVEHVDESSDEFLTGYVQALVDMHYYEFEVEVVVHDKVAYVFNLPRNTLLAGSIQRFIYDIPCINCVKRIDFCCPEQFFGWSYEEEEECYCPHPYAQVCGMWFPQTYVLFPTLVGDPREVTNSAALRFNDDVVGKHVGAVSFGDEFPFYRWKDVLCWHGDLEAGVAAGIFAVFDLDHPEACLVNTDFFVAGYLSYAVYQWAFRFRLWHLSCHIGDEFLISNPDFDRFNLSDEGVDLFVSYQCGQAIRLYGGLGYIFDRDREFSEDPLYVEFGTEVRVFGYRDCFNSLYVQPFLAMHFRSWEEHDYDIDQTYALGVEWSKLQGIGRKFRIFGEFHNGYSKEGQFVRERTNYVAIRVTYGF